MLVKNPYVKFILKGQGNFSLDVNKILRLQVTLNSRYAKNVIRYSFFRIFAEGQESRVSQTNHVFLKRGLQPHRGSCFKMISCPYCALSRVVLCFLPCMTSLLCNYLPELNSKSIMDAKRLKLYASFFLISLDETTLH